MHVPTLLLFALWLCFSLSLAAFVPLGYGIYRIVEDGENDWPQFASFCVGQLVVMALMTCSLVLLGHSISALWVWRVFSAIGSGCSILLFTAFVRRKGPNPSDNQGGAFFLFVVTAVTLVFFVCSVVVRALPYVGTSSTVPFRVEPVPVFLTQLNFWHATLYVILAIASIVCGLLFITSSRSDGPLSFERSGGGLGAGSGGWEVSNSLTYLIATIALCALLLMLLVHNDRMDEEREKRQEAAAHKTSVDVTSSPTTKPETGKTVPVVTVTVAQPAGAESDGH